jgi:hypothetical protein
LRAFLALVAAMSKHRGIQRLHENWALYQGTILVVPKTIEKAPVLSQDGVTGTLRDTRVRL